MMKRSYRLKLVQMGLAKGIASGLGVGYVPIGSGTVASLLVPLVYLLDGERSTYQATLLPSFDSTYMVIAGLFIIGVWASSLVEADWGVDSGRVVIDEILGMLITLWALPHTAEWLLAGLLLFRVLDITKPGIIRWFEDLPGGWGVMLDDVAAGISANLILRAAYVLTHA